MIDAGQPIIGRGKSILRQLLQIAQTRLELLSVELQHEKLVLVRQLRLAAIIVVCSGLAGLTLILFVALVLPPAQRAIFLAVLFFALLITTIVCAIVLKRHQQRGPLFSRVIQQLKLDGNALGPEEPLSHEQ